MTLAEIHSILSRNPDFAALNDEEREALPHAIISQGVETVEGVEIAARTYVALRNAKKAASSD